MTKPGRMAWSHVLQPEEKGMCEGQQWTCAGWEGSTEFMSFIQMKVLYGTSAAD